MKLSIVLSAQPTSFSAIPFTEGMAANIIKIRNLGYDGVELAVRNPDKIDLEWLKPFLKENNLVVPAIGTGQILSEEGLSFTNPDIEIRRRAIERVKLHVHLARELNVSNSVSVITTDCSSGNHSIGHAYDLIKTGKVKYAITAGSDVFARVVITGFGRLFAIAK